MSFAAGSPNLIALASKLRTFEGLENLTPSNLEQLPFPVVENVLCALGQPLGWQNVLCCIEDRKKERRAQQGMSRDEAVLWERAHQTTLGNLVRKELGSLHLEAKNPLTDKKTCHKVIAHLLQKVM